MTSQEFNALHIVHVIGALMLVGYTFLACAAAPEKRKQVLALAGVGSLLLLLTGVRMWQGQFNFIVAGWVIVKLVCWLAVSAVAGMAFRRRHLAGLFTLVTLLLVAIAVTMAYTKPF